MLRRWISNIDNVEVRLVEEQRCGERNLSPVGRIILPLTRIRDTREKYLHFTLLTLHYALLTMNYALCTIHYALCSMYNALCNCIMHYAVFTVYYVHLQICTMLDKN